MDAWMSGIGIVFALLYLAVVIGVVTNTLVSLWRGMRAQQQMAETLGRIGKVLARAVPPAQ